MSTAVGNTLVGNYLFGRVYSLELQTPNQNGVIWGNEKKGQAHLRITFEIERNATGSNKGRIALFNLAPNTRNAIAKGSVLKLRAGYIGLVGTLFVGIVSKVTTTRQGPDIVTSAECTDGEPFTVMTQWHQSYGPKTHIAFILKDVAKAMQVSFGSSIRPIKLQNGVARGIPDVTYPMGFVAHGPCRDTLNRLLMPLRMTWSVQNGALQIVPNAGHNGRQAEVLSAATGMIGVPTLNNSVLTLQNLLNPKVVPAGLISVQSQNTALAGYYVVRKAKYAGDTHDAAWQIDVEAALYTGQLSAQASTPGQMYSAGFVGG